MGILNIASTKNRNQFVDIMRGIAMLLVVLGHTMTGSTVNSEQSFIFNVIWSLQMPLFILISGYVTRYSKDIDTLQSLFKLLRKRTVAYLLPLAFWSFLIRGLILRQKIFFDFKYILWHMDNGYWFLATIWTISVIFGISSYISSFVKSSVFIKQAILFASYVCGMAVLGGIGYFAGMSFFCIKLTLYYMPFYFTGYLYGQYRDKIFALSFGRQAVDVIVAVCFAIWLFVLVRFNLFSMSDGGVRLIIRAVASLSGCIAVCGLLKAAICEKSNEGGYISAIRWVGVHSLEIYLTHYLFLHSLLSIPMPIMMSLKGAASVLANYTVTLTVTAIAVTLINSSKVLSFCLYGKRKQNKKMME
ncbi:MAG: acyltransferase [Clostridia bacterium]|nr:acyltransferase [Clostridia bacterium]